MSPTGETSKPGARRDDRNDPMLGYRRIAMMERRLGRRALVGGALGVAGLLAVAPGVSVAAGQEAGAPALPADAAPPDEQVYVLPAQPTLDKTPDFYESVYERLSEAAYDIFSDPLVRFDRNFDLIPAAALEWFSSPDGKTWTFRIDPTLVWNDGNPVTANDWVATFRYGADPNHGWDFTWYFQDIIRNWSQAIDPASGVGVDQIGVRLGANDRELIIETEVPAPYLPAMLLYSPPLSAAALAEHGPLYNSNPETSVSSGPLRLAEWVADQRVVYEKNPDYKGKLQVPVNRVVVKLADQKTWFTMYQNDEIDYMQYPAPADVKLAQAAFPEQIYSGVGDFRTNYLFFDVTQAPFDNPKVRQAFAHVVDRDAIKAQILGPAGVPAYSWLAPGFPAANGDALADLQRFDPALAKQLLAEAGFPEGQGFPKQTLLVRNPAPLDQSVTTSVAASITEHLGIEVEVSNRDQDSFMDALNAKPTQVPFGYVSYGMDFLDPFNMLSVWLSGGRHSWVSEAFDTRVKEAAAFIGDPAERTRLFQEAERTLVEEAPAVFVYHETPVQFVKPWIKGTVLEADENGIRSIHWPGYSAMSTVPAELYIGAEAPAGRGDL